MKKLKIISLGEVLWDLFPDGELFGGAPANFACHAALQGADVTMLSAVGDDNRGRDAVNILRDYRIDVSLKQTVPDAPTGTVGVELDENGKPTLLLNWEKVTGGPVIPYPKPGEPKPEYNIFDPCIRKKGDWYYALIKHIQSNEPGTSRTDDPSKS